MALIRFGTVCTPCACPTNSNSGIMGPIPTPVCPNLSGYYGIIYNRGTAFDWQRIPSNCSCADGVYFHLSIVPTGNTGSLQRYMGTIITCSYQILADLQMFVRTPRTKDIVLTLSQGGTSYSGFPITAGYADPSHSCTQSYSASLGLCEDVWQSGCNCLPFDIPNPVTIDSSCVGVAGRCFMVLSSQPVAYGYKCWCKNWGIKGMVGQGHPANPDREATKGGIGLKSGEYMLYNQNKSITDPTLDPACYGMNYNYTLLDFNFGSLSNNTTTPRAMWVGFRSAIVPGTGYNTFLVDYNKLYPQSCMFVNYNNIYFNFGGSASPPSDFTIVDKGYIGTNTLGPVTTCDGHGKFHSPVGNSVGAQTYGYIDAITGTFSTNILTNLYPCDLPPYLYIYSGPYGSPNQQAVLTQNANEVLKPLPPDFFRPSSGLLFNPQQYAQWIGSDNIVPNVNYLLTYTAMGSQSFPTRKWVMRTVSGAAPPAYDYAEPFSILPFKIDFNNFKYGVGTDPSLYVTEQYSPTDGSIGAHIDKLCPHILPTGLYVTMTRIGNTCDCYTTSFPIFFQYYTTSNGFGPSWVFAGSGKSPCGNKWVEIAFPMPSYGTESPGPTGIETICDLINPDFTPYPGAGLGGMGFGQGPCSASGNSCSPIYFCLFGDDSASFNGNPDFCLNADPQMKIEITI